MLSEPEWIAAFAAIVVAVLGVLGFMWNLAGKPTPLSAANIRRVIDLPNRAHTARRDARDQREQERQVHREKVEIGRLRATFYSAIQGLRKMRIGDRTYHQSEWRRAQQQCKEQTVAIMKRSGVIMSRDEVQTSPLIIHYASESMIIRWGPSKQCLEQVKLIVMWHPNPRLTRDDFYGLFFPDGDGEPDTLLSIHLTDADLEQAGWEWYSGWSRDRLAVTQ